MHQPSNSSQRIIDASLNRASEGLRVAEDVCRFHWKLSGLARELKEARHALLEAGRGAWPASLPAIEARDIENDVGRGLTAGPRGAPSLADVAFRNLQRAREALRTLEEVARLESPALARRFEAIRYQLYAVEKGIGLLRGHEGRLQRLAGVRLYLLATGSISRLPLREAVRLALEAGVEGVQLREKGMEDHALLSLAREVRELTARAGALFMVNDRLDIALASHADGVHLGQRDLPLGEARSLAGDRLLIGVSTHSLAEARRAVREGADYIGVGPVFATPTKDAGPLLGCDGLASVMAEASVPAFAVGGINPGNLGAVLAAGATRIAVASAVLATEDVPGAVRQLRKKLCQSEPGNSNYGKAGQAI
jgi:thiamine-phosphate pyrophosphorylase